MTTGDLDLTIFRALSFDCYGTLIDWEAGIAAVLGPWAREQGLGASDEELLLAYADAEAAAERDHPAARYPDVLAMAFRHTGDALGTPVSDAWARRLGDSVPDWPAFPDSAGALARLAATTSSSSCPTCTGTASPAATGSCAATSPRSSRPRTSAPTSPRRTTSGPSTPTLPGLGVGRAELLHVAQSLYHDHVPAKREGLPSVWINRRHDRPGWGATPEPTEAWAADLELPSMAAFADAVDRAFGDA